METHLRPLSVAEILDRTAQLYRENFLLFAGIASVYAGAMLLVGLVRIGVEVLFDGWHLKHQLVIVQVGGVVVLWLAQLVCGGIAVAANNRAVAWLHLGEKATIRGAYAGVRRRLGRIVWLMTLISVILWLPTMLAYGGYLGYLYRYVMPTKLLSSPAGTSNTGAALGFALVSLVFLLVLAITVSYGVVMAMRYALAVPACVVEDLKARPALRRSVHLSKGARGRIFLLGLLVFVIECGLVLVTQSVFIYASVKHHGVLPPAMRVLQQIIAFCTNTFVGPMYATGLTLFYFDQRVRKEGFDIEWMMNAAGLIAAASPSGAAAADEQAADAAAATPQTLPDQGPPAPVLPEAPHE